MILFFALACRTPQERATLDVKTYTEEQLRLLADAAVEFQAAAPVPDAEGWGADEAGPMRTVWKDARARYERVEGAIAVLFPELDAALDERYDGFLAEGADEDLFDGEGVVGVHAIERILWADAHPAEVVAFESALDGYIAAAFPASEAQARAFREELCGRFAADASSLHAQFEPVALDSAAAFRGVIGSLEEQVEKVNLAASGEDESRYAQHTLGDMRANLEGGWSTFQAFRPWIEAEGGAALASEAEDGFARLDALYANIEGDAIPDVPATWSFQAPSEEDLQTEYGRLWSAVAAEADPETEGALVERLLAIADLLGIPALP